MVRPSAAEGRATCCHQRVVRSGRLPCRTGPAPQPQSAHSRGARLGASLTRAPCPGQLPIIATHARLSGRYSRANPVVPRWTLSQVPLAAHSPAGLPDRCAADPTQPSAQTAHRAGSVSARFPIPRPWPPCTAHLCPTPCAQHVQPLNVPVRELLHVGYWASAWVDRVGLLSRAPAFSYQ